MKDARTFTFALAVVAVMLALANPAAAEQGCADGYKPTPTQNGVECRPVPGLYRGSGAGAAPRSAGRNAGCDRHGCRFRHDRHRRQPAHRGSRHPGRHGHVPAQGRQELPRRHHLFQSMRRTRLGQQPCRIGPWADAGNRVRSPSTPARKRLARSARSFLRLQLAGAGPVVRTRFDPSRFDLSRSRSIFSSYGGGKRRLE